MAPWLSTIIASIASVVAAIVTSSWFSKKMLKKDVTEELAAKLDDTMDKLDAISDTGEKLRTADVALLKDRFDPLCRSAIKKGYITFEELEAIKSLSVPFFDLDDETGEYHTLLQKVESLPLYPAKKEI